MKRTVLFTLLCVSLLYAAVILPCAAAAEEVYEENEWNYIDASMDIAGGIPAGVLGRLERIRETGKLRVATEPYFAPQEFIDPSLTGQESFVGSDMELARLIAEKMGVELEIVPLDFTKVLPAVASGDCDLAISGLSYTPGRASMVTLSKAYHTAGESAGSGLLIRRENRNRIRTLADLKDRDIAAQRGSLQEALLADRVFNYREFRRLSAMSDIFTALQQRSVDAACVDIDNAQVYIRDNPGCGLMIVPDLVFVQEEQFDGDRIAARKGETQLIAFVNGVIDELLESGQYEQWFDEYSALAGELGL